MEIYRETKFEPSPYIGTAMLENGIKILILPDGSADGSDGRKYYCISREINGDDLCTVGWTPNVNEPIIL